MKNKLHFEEDEFGVWLIAKTEIGVYKIGESTTSVFVLYDDKSIGNCETHGSLTAYEIAQQHYEKLLEQGKENEKY